MPRVTLIGYYGRDNLGDDLMLSSLLERLDESVEHLALKVCTAGPLPFALPPTARAIVTPSVHGRLAKAWALASADVVVWGGGTCLYEDGPGGTKGMRGLNRVLGICRLARTRFILLGIGLGDLHTDAGRGLARDIIAGADAVYCRDKNSRERADRLVGTAKARPAGDLAFLHPPTLQGRENSPAPMAPKIVAFCGASYYADDDMLIARYREMVTEWLAAGIEKVLFIPMHRGLRSDHAMHTKLAAGLPGDRYEMVSYDSTTDALHRLADADVAVSFRLHGIALADMIGLPCWAVAYSPKVSYYCSKTGDLGSRRLRELGAAISFSDLVNLCEDHRRRGFEIAEFVARESQAANDAVADLCQRFCTS